MNPERAFEQSLSIFGQNEPATDAFVRAIRILSPLIIKAMQQSNDDKGLDARLIESVHRLQHLSAKAQLAIDLADDDPRINHLTESLAELVAAGQDAPMTDDDIGSILRAAAQVAESLPDAPQNDEPLPLMVKSALFAPVIAMSHSLDGLEMPEDLLRETIRLLTECSIQLAATLAFQWAKKSGIDDAREQLFVSIMPATLSLTQQAWFEAIEANFPHHPWSPARSPSQNYPALLETLKACDMGWAAAEGGLLALLDRIAARLDATINWRTRDQWPKCFRNRVAGALARTLESRAVEAWEQACENLSTEVESMSEEVFAEFSQGEGSQPMRLERFEKVFNESLEASALLEPPALADPDDIFGRARKKLAFLWGISDAACQTRMVRSR